MTINDQTLWAMNAKLTDNPMPAGVSTGRIMVGIAVTPLASLLLLQAGQPTPIAMHDPYAPITK